MSAAVLVTGADGYLGRRLVRRYLERSDRDVVCWMRAADEPTRAAKRRVLATAHAIHGDRVRWAWGDLRGAEPFGDLDPGEIGIVVHAAAATQFNVAREAARAVNVEGTRKALAFAARCPRLERVALLSTVYAAGLTDGPVLESRLERPPGFANHYEWSKWAAEELLASEFRGLPWRIVRVATVIADDASGTVTQQNAFHNTLRLLFYGLLSLLPGRADTPLYFVDGESAAEAVFEACAQDGGAWACNVSPRRAESPTLEELIDIAFARFEMEPDFRARRLLRPLLCDAESFALLSEGLETFGGAAVRQGLASVAPFARQLFTRKDVVNGARPAGPDVHALVRHTCDHLVRTRWGRKGARR